MLSFAMVPAGRMDGSTYSPPQSYEDHFYIELKPISERFEEAALAVNGLDRDRLFREGTDPAEAMRAAADWLRARCAGGAPVLVAYPLGFDWSWIHWYFVRFVGTSPFKHFPRVRSQDRSCRIRTDPGFPCRSLTLASFSLVRPCPHTSCGGRRESLRHRYSPSSW